MDNMQKKWDLRYQEVDIESAPPAKVLVENSHLLPTTGKALDLACGAGGNAIFLAQNQMEVDAFDNSPVVISKLDSYSKQHMLQLSAQLLDVEKSVLPTNTYDIITVSYFLERSLFKGILNALKKDGLLFYQTWSQEKVSEQGPNTPQFRLKKGELLHLCKGLDLVLYREEGNIGDTQKGFRDKVLYIGKKPK